MTKKILLLGSGELGKEFVIACQRKGQYVIACDSYAHAPAMQVADECEVFHMLDGDTLMAVVEKHKPDIIVPEIEAIRTEKLYDCEKMGIQVVPSARAVNFTMNRKEIRELAHTELGLKTADYRYAKTFDELKAAADVIGFPCIIKPLMSSSGHGQSKVDSPADLAHAWEYACAGARGDVKTLSATIGHVSSATTLDIYSHITDTMQRQAAVHIDRKIGGTDAQMPTIAREERKDTSPVEFTPYKPKIQKPGTGCVTMINDHLYEGRYTPTNAYGKWESHNIYAKTREECKEKLAEMIAEVKAQIKAEKERLKAEQEA